MNIKKSNFNVHNLSFSGHKKMLDKAGYEKHNFYYLYDPYKYDCAVELYNIVKDKETGNISIDDESSPAVVFNMPDGGIGIDLFDVPEIYSDEGFAYRFKLTDKDTKEISYAFDNGIVIGISDYKKDPKNYTDNNTDNKYNVVLNNGALINKNGPMQLIMPDEYFPGIENKDGKPSLNDALRAKALTSVRTHANKLGGNFYGIIKRLPEISKEGVTRIVGTPFTKDPISSHLYWTANAYQTAPGLGNEEDFRVLQQELFKNGINWISDAALVNEGFGGIHLSELLRKGSGSFSKDMFRADEKISLGILPDKCDYTRMKIINAPFVLEENGTYKNDNPSYNPAKPTYIQFYDERLVSEEQKASDSPKRMMTYDKNNTSYNPEKNGYDIKYDITKHDDAVYPFPLEVDPYELQRNVKKTAEKEGKVDLSDIETVKKVADFSNFKVVNKSEAGGLEVWDGNVDIAKLNFYMNDKDAERFSKLPLEDREEAIADFQRGTLAVRDYALNSGKYWTKLTSDIQMDYIVSAIGGLAETSEEYTDLIKKLVSNNMFPANALQTIDEEVTDNVLNGSYHLRTLDDADMRADINPEGCGNQYTVSDYILRQAMDVPLETLHLGTDLLGIITSPYIAKKANTESELGVSRYDLTKADNPNLPEKYENVYSRVDELYEDEITPLIYDVVKDIPGISENGMVTDYGKYIISAVAPDLTKYILTKSIVPNADISIEEGGHINFSDVDDEEITMQSLGIPYSGKTLEEESQMLVDIIEKGISNLDKDDLNLIKQKLQSKYANYSLNDFKVAEMILDRTESGLGWRIDAAKDIASIDAARSNYDDIRDSWKNVTDFWKLYNRSVLEINPHAYTTAEITDLPDLMLEEEDALYENAGDAERKFLQETGITSIANYNYFFSLLPELFSIYSFENGSDSWKAKENKNFELREKLDTGWTGNPGFLFQSPEDGIINSYTFFGNHDKPRVLHCLALDMGLFHSDFAPDKETLNQKDVSGNQKTHRSIAAEVLQKNGKDIDLKDADFDKISSKAIAMGSRINTAFDSVIGDTELKNQLKNAVADLAAGTFKGESFDSEAFGTRPFEIAIKSVFDQAEYNTGAKIQNREELEAKTLESILKPAFNRFYSMYKLLITLPGSPADFAGDRVGSSGYETKAKNYHQQNRNVIHWEWLEDENKYNFVKVFYENMNNIANLRSQKALSALNDGATVTVPIREADEKIDNKGNKSYDKKKSEFIQAFLRYNDSGSVVLTLHDSSGSNSVITSEPARKTSKIGNFVIKDENDKGSDNSKTKITHDRLFLDLDTNNAKQGLKHGLKPGTRFKNVREGDDTIYKIAKMQKDGKELYYLKRENKAGQELSIEIKPEDFNTLILYKV